MLLLVVEIIFVVYGFEVFDVEELFMYGGSLCVFVWWKVVVFGSVMIGVEKVWCDEVVVGFDYVDVYIVF